MTNHGRFKWAGRSSFSTAVPAGTAIRPCSVIAKGAGHTVSRFDLQEMDIHGCLGCMKGGRDSASPCMQKDDMEKIYPVYKEADIVVLASPLYFWTYSGQLRIAFDRLFAVAEGNPGFCNESVREIRDNDSFWLSPKPVEHSIFSVFSTAQGIPPGTRECPVQADRNCLSDTEIDVGLGCGCVVSAGPGIPHIVQLGTPVAHLLGIQVFYP